MEDLYINNFIRYCKVSSASDDDSATQPSTQRQFNLAKIMKAELEALNVEDVELDDSCYVYGYINKQNTSKRVVLVAHMDVSPEAPSENVQPIVHEFVGKDLVLPHATILASKLKNIEIGQKIITSDGSTLLGGDDKAGLAIIMTLIKYLNDNVKLADLPSICICFTPDEEIGRGTAAINMEKLTSNIKDSYGLTIDGGRNYELAFETFNAYGFSVNITGYNVHPGSAYKQMCNALLYGSKLVNLIQQTFATPELSRAAEPYILVNQLTGDVSNCLIKGIIRSFSDTEILDLNQQLSKLVDKFYQDEKVTANSDQFKVECSIKFQYSNMRKFIPDSLVTYLNEKGKSFNAQNEMIRGGTDGARLSEMGLPTPNVWNGSANFHSVKEYNVSKEAVDCVNFLVKVLLDK
ncbi:Peptidase_T [Hexamita inflata]|uniref:Peptidase T n=1 Tax=Hexamita inflata TaxID=28002 RepID=A0AA86R6J0_9EUKA|nr:Peptidase T [Hexamita inflata]